MAVIIFLTTGPSQGDCLSLSFGTRARKLWWFHSPWLSFRSSTFLCSGQSFCCTSSYCSSSLWRDRSNTWSNTNTCRLVGGKRGTSASNPPPKSPSSPAGACVGFVKWAYYPVNWLHCMILQTITKLACCNWTLDIVQLLSIDQINNFKFCRTYKFWEASTLMNSSPTVLQFWCTRTYSEISSLPPQSHPSLGF